MADYITKIFKWSCYSEIISKRVQLFVVVLLNKVLYDLYIAATTVRTETTAKQVERACVYIRDALLLGKR